jgi:hypothetical protein
MMKKLAIILLAIVGFNSFAHSQDLYDINTINTVEITFQESNWDYLLDQLYAAGLEERLMGSVTINGQVFDSVGVRYKGNSTYSPNQVKNPFNIKLDYIIDDQLYGDYGTLKLANAFKDPSFVREVLGYEIARKYFPASGSNYANVYVNGTHLGLYTNDQDVDKFFMRSNFGSDENTRVKGEITTSGPPSGGVWEYYGTDSSSYYGYYEMKSDYGWKKLIGFLDTLSNDNDYVDQVLNIDRHLWFLAFSNLFVNLDGPINNPQNHYLYEDDNGRFNPIPWDLNECFGVFTSHQTLGQLGTSQLQQFSPYANINESDFPVVSKILSNDTYKKMYVAHMKTILEENVVNGLYETRALEIQDMIDDDVQADQNKFYTYANFISNVYNQVGGGPMGIIGIVQLMDARNTYLQSLPDFQYTAPSISNVAHSPAQASPGSEITFTATVASTVDVFLAYRSRDYWIFEKIMMYDDGNHGDGQAGDGIYGVFLTAGSTDIQYYIYAENSDAVAFSPVRAEYEFYEISISGDLVINEFMADNETAVADQDGDYDDWIELYNNGSEDINLYGYYLSDDVSDPYQWMFPDTMIMAGGYLIVWADDDGGQQGLHANFKLSKSGESIVLSDNNQNLLDQVNFLQQKTDTTTGRYPNGTGDFVEMLPTFGAENTNTVVNIIESPDFNNSAFTLNQNHPNPFSSSTKITFKLEKGEDVTLNIYNQQGSLIETLVSGYLSSGDHTYTWNSEGCSKGMYFYSLTGGGQVQVKKMIIQ